MTTESSHFCGKCGVSIADATDEFCPNCGAPYAIISSPIATEVTAVAERAAREAQALHAEKDAVCQYQQSEKDRRAEAEGTSQDTKPNQRGLVVPTDSPQTTPKSRSLWKEHRNSMRLLCWIGILVLGILLRIDIIRIGFLDWI
jgi:hypothetical protein